MLFASLKILIIDTTKRLEKHISYQYAYIRFRKEKYKFIQKVLKLIY